jgi:hypothetical protein
MQRTRYMQSTMSVSTQHHPIGKVPETAGNGGCVMIRIGRGGWILRGAGRQAHLQQRLLAVHAERRVACNEQLHSGRLIRQRWCCKLHQS